MENNLPNENSFNCNREIKEYLLETSKWGKFLAILGFIGVGILVMVAIVVMIGFTFINKIKTPGFPTGLIGFIYLALAVVYYFPVSYLNRFSIEMKKGLESGDANEVTVGFQNLKSLFKFMGILAIVIFSIYGLILIVALPLMYFASSH